MGKVKLKKGFELVSGCGGWMSPYPSVCYSSVTARLNCKHPALTSPIPPGATSAAPQHPGIL
eukprot:1150742-Pelagomonas_calceolata.AAC.4